MFKRIYNWLFCIEDEHQNKTDVLVEKIKESGTVIKRRWVPETETFIKIPDEIAADVLKMADQIEDAENAEQSTKYLTYKMWKLICDRVPEFSNTRAGEVSIDTTKIVPRIKHVGGGYYEDVETEDGA